MEENTRENKMGTMPIGKLLANMAGPVMISMLFQALYNIVDSVFVARLSQDAMNAVSLAFPLQTLCIAFAVGTGVGMNALLARSLGEKNMQAVDRAAGTGLFLTLCTAAVFAVLGFSLATPFFRFQTENAQIIAYGSAYVMICIGGSLGLFLQIYGERLLQSTGRTDLSMISQIAGAVCNIVLDPIFIFMLHMGIRGAALATILSQLLSAIWILRFLTSDKTILKLRRSSMHLSARRIRKIVGLGLSGFTMAITNCTVQIMCNATLQVYGGDLYVGVMTVINSIREIATLPVPGVTHSAQPVLGFNYGAKEYGRVKKAIVFTSFIAILYTTGIWLIVDGFPAFFIRIFNQDAELIAAGIPAIRLYFFGFFMMSLQFSGQSIFVGLGESKKAIFFSIFRKVIIVVPLTILLPGMFGMGTNGVFAAEPISNFIGGIACFGTMLFTIWLKLTKLQKQEAV